MKKLVFTLLLVITSVSFVTAQETEQKKQEFGLHFENLSAEQKAFNAETSGVVITKVTKDQPAKVAGVKVGDILTHIDATAIKDQDHATQLIKDYYNASKGFAMLKVIRNGVKMDIKVSFK